MIYIKTADQISHISVAGKISKSILLDLLSNIASGVTKKTIDDKAEFLLSQNGSSSWFKEVDAYKYATCISVNDEWIHGIPDSYKFKEGDIVSVDIGVKKDGYYVDNCWTVPVYQAPIRYTEFPRKFPKADNKISKFLEVGVESLYRAINSIDTQSRVGRISSTMQEVVESAGYSVIREYAGHGVGLTMHEDPLISCFGGENSGPTIKNGMVFAVEVMYSMGRPDIHEESDGWTVRSADSSLTGMFEHTVAVVNDRPEILTN